MMLLIGLIIVFHESTGYALSLILKRCLLACTNDSRSGKGFSTFQERSAKGETGGQCESMSAMPRLGRDPEPT